MEPILPGASYGMATNSRATCVNRHFRKTYPMRAPRNRLCLLSLAVAGLVLLSIEPSLGEDLAVPCSAFSRNGDGDWKVLAPVMLHIEGRLFGPIVGTTFAPGTMTNGIS